MRYYIICRGLYPGSRPWVLAETVDEAYARDEADTWSTTVVVSRQEALCLPGLREAVRFWDERDDGEYRREMAKEDAEEAFDERAEEPEVEATPDLSIPQVLTFAQFRELLPHAEKPEDEIRRAYLEYVRLEAAWDRVDDAAAG